MERQMLPSLLCTVLPPVKEELRPEGIDREVVGAQLYHLMLASLDAIYSEQQHSEDGALRRAQLLLDVAWEKLNTGHWKDVSSSWRYLYSYASLAKAVSLVRGDKLKEALLACDMGLLMGAPFMDNLLAKVAECICKQLLSPAGHTSDHNASQQLQKRQKQWQAPPIAKDHRLPEIQCPSLERFLQEFANAQRPALICGAIDHWPALSHRKWSVESLLERIGWRTVPVEIGAKYTDESWSQKLMTFREFVQTFVSGREEDGAVGYLAQHQLFHQIPELEEDVEVPMYCYLADAEGEPDVNVWFGPGGTVSPLHYDPKENFLTQVFGEKYVRLYSKEATPLLYPHQDHLLHNTSQVDAEKPDKSKFPLFESADFWECILRPGEMLYIPAGCWHYVRSLSTSLSISFWWVCPPR